MLLVTLELQLLISKVLDLHVETSWAYLSNNVPLTPEVIVLPAILFIKKLHYLFFLSL